MLHKIRCVSISKQDVKKIQILGISRANTSQNTSMLCFHFWKKIFKKKHRFKESSEQMLHKICRVSISGKGVKTIDSRNLKSKCFTKYAVFPFQENMKNYRF